MSIDDIAVTSNEISDMSCELPYPDTIGCSASSQTPRIITVNVGVFIVSQAVHIVCFGLGDACSAVHAIDEFARKRFGVALSG